MTIIVALFVAAVVGSAVFPYRRYRFWWKWSHSIFGLALFVIFVINGVFGLIGVGIAEGAAWHPWHEGWRNGVSFAMLGLAIVRVRLPGVDVDAPQSSVHALRTIMRFTFGLLDDVAEDTIRTTLATLEHQEIRELVAYILTREVIPDRSLDSQDRAIETDKMAKADGRLRKGDRAAWAEMLAWCVLQTRQRLLVIDRLRNAQ
jgi:hypothetical protein